MQFAEKGALEETQYCGAHGQLIVRLSPARLQSRSCWLPAAHHRYDKLPSYLVFAGLVFVPLSQPYLHEYGEDWWVPAGAGGTGEEA